MQLPPEGVLEDEEGVLGDEEEPTGDQGEVPEGQEGGEEEVQEGLEEEGVVEPQEDLGEAQEGGVGEVGAPGGHEEGLGSRKPCCQNPKKNTSPRSTNNFFFGKGGDC